MTVGSLNRAVYYNAMADIDIITTTYRSAAKLAACTKAVIEKTKYVDYCWYIWANDPNQEMKDTIHNSMHIDGIQFTDRIVPIYNDNNDGSFSSNNNAAAAEGDSKYILFLNDDTMPINDTWLLNMKRILDTDDKAGAVGALLLYPDRKTIQHCGVMFSQRTNSLPFHMFYRQPIGKVASFISVPRVYQAVTAACMLVRREDFEKLGGFSEDYFYGFEDPDFCLRLQHQLGKKCIYTPAAQVIHDEGISGSFKNHPRLKENILALRTRQAGKFFNDEMFYLNNKNYMVYTPK